MAPADGAVSVGIVRATAILPATLPRTALTRRADVGHTATVTMRASATGREGKDGTDTTGVARARRARRRSLAMGRRTPSGRTATTMMAMGRSGTGRGGSTDQGGTNGPMAHPRVKRARVGMTLPATLPRTALTRADVGHTAMVTMRASATGREGITTAGSGGRMARLLVVRRRRGTRAPPARRRSIASGTKR